MDVTRLGQAGLHGWRERVADPIARRAPVADDVVRAAFGAVFFALSLAYVVKSVRALVRELRRPGS
jgi:hypothetical protein